jgi:D-aspartate ligase
MSADPGISATEDPKLMGAQGTPAAGGAVPAPTVLRDRRRTSEKFPVAVFDNFWGATVSVVYSLGRRGVPVHLYGRGACRWSRYRTRHAWCPPVEDSERFLPWLEHRIRSGEITRVAPTTDLIAYYLSFLRECFAPEVRRTIAPLAEIERCLIKSRFVTACGQAGQAVPRTAAPEDAESAVIAAQEIGYPLFLKPKSHLGVGTIERGAILRSVGELRERFRAYPIVPGQEFLASRYPEIRWPLLQEYIPTARTQVFSVSGFRDPDTGVIAASLSVKRGQWPPDSGTSIWQQSCRNDRILRHGLAGVNGLLSRGMFELELLARDAELLAIDLNPRAFGFLPLELARGNDLPWLWWQSTLGLLEPQPLQPPDDDLCMIEARLSIPHAVDRCVRAVLGVDRKNNDQDTGGRTVTKIVSMIGHWPDPIPLLLGNLRLLKHPRALVRPYVRAALCSRKPLSAEVSS